MYITLDRTAYKYCAICGNASDKEKKECDICGTDDENQFIPITVSQDKEITQTIKNHIDNIITEEF
jgi:recombinational DNA repair protein RecR